MSDDATTPEPGVLVLLLYVGQRVNGFGPDTQSTFYKIERDELQHAMLPPNEMLHERIHRYTAQMARKLGACVPGAVYEMHEREGGIVSYKTGQMPIALWEGEMQRTQWQAESKAVTRAADAQRRMLSGSSRDLVHETLKPIRDTYAKLGSPAQAQLIADVVAYIVRGYVATSPKPKRKKK